MFSTELGKARPLGAVPDENGVNFPLFSERATSVELLLFDSNGVAPTQVIDLKPGRDTTFHFWHVYVRGAKPGLRYAYRVHGPQDLHGRGDRFDGAKVVIDPYSRGISTTFWNRGAACGPGDNGATALRGVVVDTVAYDWEGDAPINRPMRESIIYEMHVGGFTRAASSGVAHPGTFAAVVEKIPYLKSLGITAVELLPVFQFDETEVGGTSPIDGAPLSHYWGYSTVGFFAPHGGYCVSPDASGHLDEFRDMVKALHRAGIEVILDVVFNHTSEGNQFGPTISFRALENGVYYHLVPGNREYYLDYSGCGNTVNCNHPIVEKLIVECLEFWVREMHVDGFRFDEGSILSRGEDGAPLVHPPVVWAIELSETLANTKIIAEAWDAAGLYQIGYFPGWRWAEWNGRYRDDIRRFVRGDAGIVGQVAVRIAGSADLYQWNDHLPTNSINFVTCHDGFTLNDLVSYNGKHNEANGEGNRDGINENLSWNCGVEGGSDDARIESFRERQIKNFFALLLLSEGVPMILAGDEVRQTQDGNNNVYCQDNARSWFDWDRIDRHAPLLRFFQQFIAFRKEHTDLMRGKFFTGETNARGLPDIMWHGCLLNGPGWNDPSCRVLAYTMGASEDALDLHVMCNMQDEDLAFAIPVVAGRGWYRTVDTALASPQDIMPLDAAPEIADPWYRVNGRSIVILQSK